MPLKLCTCHREISNEIDLDSTLNRHWIKVWNALILREKVVMFIFRMSWKKCLLLPNSNLAKVITKQDLHGFVIIPFKIWVRGWLPSKINFGGAFLLQLVTCSFWRKSLTLWQITCPTHTHFHTIMTSSNVGMNLSPQTKRERKPGCLWIPW